MDRRTFELLREEREEALGRMPGRPDSGELAQAGIDALAVERLCMRPEGTAELDARCDFDALSRRSTASASKIGRAHVWTSVTYAHIVCRLLREKKNLTHAC